MGLAIRIANSSKMASRAERGGGAQSDGQPKQQASKNDGR